MYNDDFLITKLQIQDRFAEMTQNAEVLFQVDADKDELWNLYLDNVAEEENFMFRERRSNDCSACRHFVRSIGNVVTIRNGKVHTLWGFEAEAESYRNAMAVMDQYIKSRPITGMYLSPTAKVGVDKNYEQLEDGTIHTWDHFYLELPKRFVCSDSDLIASRLAEFRSVKNVFQRSLAEISSDAVMTVLELIDSNTLYRGAEWKNALENFLRYKHEYSAVGEAEKELYAWEHTKEAGIPIGKIRNHSIGVLLQDITEDVDLESAIRKYEKIVAPANYKRPKAIFTKKMLEEAQAKITELGYMPSLPRRFANLDDISINNILFANRDASSRIVGADDLFASLMNEAKDAASNLSRAEEISIEKFITGVLPHAKSVEAYVQNKHIRNMVSLIAPKNPDAPTMFKWGNGFCWAYSGNITDSDMKQNVKNAGGNVEGDLRFSIQWNDGNDYNPNDFDAHCKHPNGEIYFANKVDRYSGGNLDVDIIHPTRSRAAVENIAFPNKRNMKPGTYTFFVHCYSNRGGRTGFSAEIEFDGTIHTYSYGKELRADETIPVADVILDQFGNFTITDRLRSEESSRECWGITTNQFVPVTVVMHSPNYWDEQTGIGNKHYFFMLKDCVNPERPNAFFNEFLKNELIEHRRVLEALGGRLAVDDVEDQLSGIGFSSTVRNDLVVKVTGATERLFKIIF